MPITIPTNCTMGYYCPQGTSIPVPCPIGTYGNGYNYVQETDCQDCTPGMYCETEGMVAPTANCSEGHYCTGAAETAQPLNHNVSTERYLEFYHGNASSCYC